MPSHQTTTTRRTRTIRRQVSRSNARCAKSGYIEQKGNAYYVRFWMDVPGQEERKHMSVRLCSVRGPGKLTKSERERKAREVIAASGAAYGLIVGKSFSVDQAPDR